MLTGPFLSKNWMASTDCLENSDCIMVGLPYDGTCSYKPGSRFAPQEIRTHSWGIETYSPIMNKDIADVAFYDAGDLEFSFGNREETLNLIEKTALEVINLDKKWLGIGGEHLVTLPAVKACLKKYPNLVLIHFDAHADLLEDYLGEKLSHAAVIRRILEFISPLNLIQAGIRSGTKAEFDWIKQNNTLVKSHLEMREKIKNIGENPVYLSVDLDVLDPSIMSGTGTPEPGGMMFNEFINYLSEFKNLNIIGADVTELAPGHDFSGVSTITAAKIIREILLLF